MDAMTPSFPPGQSSGPTDNSTTNPNLYPMYVNSILVPVLAFPAWILCIPPFIWHFSQRNIPAWSLVLYIIITNFFNAINPLIWPRDNIQEWFDGVGLCDIEVRFFVGMSVGLPVCTAMIMRKLASVMDTGNITLGPSRKEVIKEKVLEGTMCWGYPLLLILLYYLVQPIRYFIFGISGCIVAFNLSWVSIVLNAMWPPITAVFSSYYAGLLAYRLYRYRKDFHRLIAAQDTTKSRFMRLLTISVVIIIVLVPYSFWILWLFASQLNEDYNFNTIHGPGWNSVAKVPSDGVVRLDKWGQIACGYITFFILGTGADANNTYKRMLCAIGLGKIFPSLYKESVSDSGGPSRFSVLCSQYSSKARTLFSRSQNDTMNSKALSTTNSLSGDTIMLSTQRSGSFQPILPITTHDMTLPPRDLRDLRDLRNSRRPSHRKSWFSRLFSRSSERPLLPFGKRNVTELVIPEKSNADALSSGVYTHAWASNSPTAVRASHDAGDSSVHIIQEVHREVHHDESPSKEMTTALAKDAEVSPISPASPAKDKFT